VLVVYPSFPAHSAKELVDMAKAKPGEINYASGGIGSAPHLAAEVFKSMAGINMVHVAYKGSTPAINDVVAGHVPMIFTGIPSVLSFIKSGRLRAIGVTSAQRTNALPDVPTIASTGVPGYDVSPWFGVLAPAHTPRTIVLKLNTEIVRVLNDKAIRERFATEGVDPVGDSPEHFTAYIKAELAKWGKVLQDSGIRAE
jgi:tripartite-type tricarboxylate transporter receptor subunit TctC